MRIGPIIAGLALAASGALLFAPQGGCATTCNTSGQNAIEYTGGDRVGAIYETTPVDGTWLDFPAGRRYKLMHHFGTTKYLYNVSLAFDPHPVPQYEGGVGNSSPGAGNELIIEDYGADYFQVRNDTCAEYYLRVVLMVDPSADANDAGAD